jgi:predicted dehydrogenase
MNSKTIKVGLIGSGAITRFIHVPGFQLCPDVQVTVACDSSIETAEITAHMFGIPKVSTDYHQVIQDPDIDAIVIATPNNLHKPMCLEAFAAGKHVLCEKPMGLNFAECDEMLSAAQDSGLVHFVSFVYRFVPAMRYFVHLSNSGLFGEIRHFRAQYLQRVPDIWLGWRSRSNQAGAGGALGDVGPHLIDFARQLVGEINAVSGWTKIFLPQRRVAGTDSYVDCDVDDAAGFLAEFENGATGVFEVSRMVLGRGVGRNDYQYVEVNGSKASAVYYLQDPFNLQICPGHLYDEERLVTMQIPDSFLKWPESPRRVMDNEPNVGFRYDQAFAFIQAIRGVGLEGLPNFMDGQRAQAVVDAVVESARTRYWVGVKR